MSSEIQMYKFVFQGETMAKEKASQTSTGPTLAPTQQSITQNSTSNLYGNAFVQQQMSQGASNMSLGSTNMTTGGSSSQGTSSINNGGSKVNSSGGNSGGSTSGSTTGSSGGGIQRGNGPIIESLFSPDYMVEPTQSTNVLVQGSNLSNNGQINWDANWHGPNGFQKKSPTPHAGPNIDVPFNFGEINPLRPHDRIRLDVTARTPGATDSETREFIVRPNGGGGGDGDTGSNTMVFHDFDNNANKDISLTHTGDIQSVVSESKPAPDGLYSTDMSAKHYRIKMNSNYENISVTGPGSEAAGGAKDAGISVARVFKESPSVYRVWFNRSKGANTYVNQFSVNGTKE